ALRVAARFQREPEVVEGAGVPRGAFERALEISDRRVVLAALAQAVAEVEQRFRVALVDRERFAPRRFRGGGIALDEDLAQKVPCDRVRRIEGERRSTGRLGVRTAERPFDPRAFAQEVGALRRAPERAREQL